MVGFLVGSAEGFTQADKAINASSKSGRWVMLKNVHLAPNWLVSLEKKLHSLTPHPSFRLFLTMEINPKVSKLKYIVWWSVRFMLKSNKTLVHSIHLNVFRYVIA